MSIRTFIRHKDRLILSCAAIAFSVACAPAPARANDEIADTDKAAFNLRLFAKSPDEPKTYACFVRRYDSDHLARHPKQKVNTMKLLVTAEKDDGLLSYSFRLGVNYRHRAGQFDSSGFCNHAQLDEAMDEIRLGCGVDCDGGGIGIANAKDGRSAIVRLERVRIWRNNKPDEDASDELVAGADDRIFRLERTGLNDCAALVTDRKELAAMRQK